MKKESQMDKYLTHVHMESDQMMCVYVCALIGNAWRRLVNGNARLTVVTVYI